MGKLFARMLAAAGALAMLAGGTAARGQVGPEEPRRITVTGSGEVAAAPDRATVTLAVETEAASADQAAAANAGRATRVRTALDQLDVPLTVTTSAYSLGPVYSQPERGEEEPIVRGYVAHNELRVELQELAAVGRVIDAAITAGANRVQSVEFALEENAEAIRAALGEAGRDARVQAEAVATALGVRLGAVAFADAGGSGQPPMPFHRVAAMDMAASSTPIEPGTLTVRATLTVGYAIAD